MHVDECLGRGSWSCSVNGSTIAPDPGAFTYDRCLMKHHVRRVGWLTACKRRLQVLRRGRPKKQVRRLRYFTFCATNAIDVLMLDVERVIRRSNDGRFDTVYFFCREDESILETRKSIPGANGFAGSFVDVVLIDDPDETDVVDPNVGLPEETPDTRATRQDIQRLSTHRDLLRAFPFDVLNLDLEGYLFKARDQIPGKLVRALRRTFEYQKRALGYPNGERIDQFTMMFTTKVGPQNMGDDFLGMLRDSLDNNLNAMADLRPIMETRTGNHSAGVLQGANFDEFFKLAAPKIIAQTLMDADWYIDPAPGLIIYEFERTPQAHPPYRMLHLVMDVRRHVPPSDARAPGTQSQTAFEAYRQVVQRLFQNGPTQVSDATIDQDKLTNDLGRIDQRREKYRRGDT
jgi:hypothetical protein